MSRTGAACLTLALGRTGAACLALTLGRTGAACLALTLGRTGAACLALALALIAGTPAASGAPDASSAQIVAAVPGDGDEVWLIGSSGQIFYPTTSDGALQWVRKHAGGVATDVRGAVRATGKLYVAGPRAPLYRFANQTWSVHPLSNRGRSVMAVGGHPAVSVGRHIYLWRTRSWTRLARIPGEITALWASSESKVYVATDRGIYRKHKARAFAPIRHPLAASDRVVTLVGRSGKALYAIAQSGTVLDVGASRARALTLDNGLDGFVPQAATVDASGTLIVAAATQASADGSSVLVQSRRRKLIVLDQLDGLDRDPVTLVHAAPGRLILVTRSGAVRVRLTDGRWQTASIVTELPTQPRSNPGAGPARTR